MSAIYCDNCHILCVATSGNENRWECPRCHHVIFSIQVSDKVQVQEELRASNQSSETIDGLPAREGARHTAIDGSGSGVDVERTEDGRSNVSRTRIPSGPLRRDSGGARKRQEEVKVINLLLPEYNNLHGTGYENPESGTDEDGDDVIAKSPIHGEPKIRFQVTFADNDGALRASISKGEIFSAKESEEDILNRASVSLLKKALAPDHEAILVLDGAGIVSTHGTVKRFVSEYRKALEASPFREIWWVDQGPGGVILRLFPDHTSTLPSDGTN